MRDLDSRETSRRNLDVSKRELDLREPLKKTLDLSKTWI